MLKDKEATNFKKNERVYNALSPVFYFLTQKELC